MGCNKHGSTVDRDLDRLASKSHGVVSRRQLLGIGITAEQVRQRMTRGALIREYRGVWS